MLSFFQVSVKKLHRRLGRIVYHPTQEFHQYIYLSIYRTVYIAIYRYRILAGQPSLGKLGGREVKMSVLVNRKVVDSNPDCVVCGHCFTDTRKALRMLFITGRKNFICYCLLWQNHSIGFAITNMYFTCQLVFY